MKTKTAGGQWWWAGVALAVAALGLAGCAGPRSTLDLASYKDPYFPEHRKLELTGATYWVNAARDIQIAGRVEQTDLDGNPITEFVHVQVYWQPHPGKTYADSTMLNAMIRYVVAGQSGVVVYSGTGFAYPKRGFGKLLDVDIESAALQPVTIKGEAPDVLGETRVTGTLVAKQDPNRTAGVLREAELRAAR